MHFKISVKSTFSFLSEGWKIQGGSHIRKIFHIQMEEDFIGISSAEIDEHHRCLYVKRRICIINEILIVLFLLPEHHNTSHCKAVMQESLLFHLSITLIQGMLLSWLGSCNRFFSHIFLDALTPHYGGSLLPPPMKIVLYLS